jgi:hypothetical protein
LVYFPVNGGKDDGQDQDNSNDEQAAGLPFEVFERLFKMGF